MGAWALCFHSLTSTQTFWRSLTASMDSCMEIRVPLQWCNQFWQSLEEGAGKRCSKCDPGCERCRHRKLSIVHCFHVIISILQRVWDFIAAGKDPGCQRRRHRKKGEQQWTGGVHPAETGLQQDVSLCICQCVGVSFECVTFKLLKKKVLLLRWFHSAVCLVVDCLYYVVKRLGQKCFIRYIQKTTQSCLYTNPHSASRLKSYIGERVKACKKACHGVFQSLADFALFHILTSEVYMLMGWIVQGDWGCGRINRMRASPSLQTYKAKVKMHLLCQAFLIDLYILTAACLISIWVCVCVFVCVYVWAPACLWMDRRVGGGWASVRSWVTGLV